MFYNLLLLLSRRIQKKIIVFLITNITNSTDATIDESTATTIIEQVAKSKGNRITTFIVKE